VIHPPASCRFLALPHLQVFELDFSDLFSKAPKLSAWSAVLAYSLVMIFDIGTHALTWRVLAGFCLHVTHYTACATFLNCPAPACPLPACHVSM
jgi:hypothetical protein